MIQKIIHKIREGILQDIIAEIKWIYSYAKNYRKEIAVYILLSTLATLFGMGSNVSSKYLIDVVTEHKDDLVVQTAALYICFGLSKIILNAVVQRISTYMNVTSSNEIRTHVFRQFLNIDWQASLNYHSGDLLTRVNSDVSTVSDSILGLIPNLIVGTVQFTGTLIIILVYDPIMAIIALLSAPVTVFMSRFFLSKIRSFGVQMRQAQAELTAFYEEALQNLQAIKSFSLNEKFSGQLKQLQDLYKDVMLNHNLFSVKTYSLLSSISFVVSGLCFTWGIYRLWSGYISFGTMVLFIQMANTLSASFSKLVSLVPSAISATVSARRIMTILELPQEDLTVSPEAASVMEHAPADGVGVQIEQLSFAYESGRKIFDNLTMHAAPGEIIGIVSPSGGGKTSLIRSLLGLVTPSTGTITLSSGGYSALLTPCMRNLITYVAQEKVVFSGTIADSLRVTNPGATDAELDEALRFACAGEFVSKLSAGVHTPLKERGAGLSEGQLQRLAIARAMLSKAPVMLLDEATSALDLATERIVLKNLLSSNQKRTIILTTHRPTALLSCDRVYSIEDGYTRILSKQEVHTLAGTEL